MLDKIYKGGNKFSGTSDIFNFKVIIFYNKCIKVRLLPNAYIYNATIMLSNQTHIYIYTNYDIISILDQFYINM